MELNQIFNFPTKNYQNVANLPEEDYPDTVLLFEPRIDYPALRVTAIVFILKMNDFFRYFTIKIEKILKKSIFSNFSFLSFFSARERDLRVR